MQNLADFKLLENIRSGKSDAFAVFFNTYWEEVFREAFYRLKSYDEAQDMVQDIFTDCWLRREQLTINTSISAYLLGALKHKIIRHIGRNKLHKEVVDHLLQQMTVFEDSIVDIIAAGEVQKTLEEAIASFPTNMRQIFALRTQDFTIAEIAEALALSPQTVKNNTTDALRRLKQVLAEKHPDVSSSLYVLLILFIES
ncbi:sigma-70 family RNA polymerase sigma factor [Sphingobacterium oryzagri]|uniref:Sigma-70 family RNA polymerase sigma factor n=1 Tax=Sphingobacterium oryzagri TaxID=3025669 RepID=A0ABY7WL21_9SPHI|nr:sigma-70 family RNA polymerase sigma factor [Sphingobacterium sp. KACC 22765]WDF69010.1 sigma-70 family RNA polymerase sigma factor [Sphingobacterium sp. KACC 22765]